MITIEKQDVCKAGEGTFVCWNVKYNDTVIRTIYNIEHVFDLIEDECCNGDILECMKNS